MNKIQTQIIINASATDVWDTLIDFRKYNEWNPFIKSIDGNPVVGEKLKEFFPYQEDDINELPDDISMGE